MLIQSPLVRSAGATKAATARAPVDGAGFSLSLGQGRATAAPSGPIASSALASLGTLLMLQEDVEIGERRRKAVKRGNQLLDDLDELRRAMLTDADPRAALGALRTELDRDPGLIADPELQSTLADIELRVAVELAKLERDALPAKG